MVRLLLCFISGRGLGGGAFTPEVKTPIRLAFRPASFGRNANGACILASSLRRRGLGGSHSFDEFEYFAEIFGSGLVQQFVERHFDRGDKRAALAHLFKPEAPVRLAA